MVSDQAYYQLLEENSRLESQLSALREALDDAVEWSGHNGDGRPAFWIDKALSALEEVEK